MKYYVLAKDAFGCGGNFTRKSKNDTLNEVVSTNIRRGGMI